MKTGFVRHKAGSLGLLLGFSSSAAVAAAIGLSITPAGITNNYVGHITFSITNLTPGMTVNLDLYADLNSNGIIDAADLPAESFSLTDGQVPGVAGIRNLNAPGDDDGLTNGQILVQYNYPGAGGGVWSGKFLFRASDPAGTLAPATQTVSIVQQPYAQTVRGRIILAGTGLPLTNCALAAVTFGSATYLGMTDADGNYMFYGLPPGYVVVGFNQQGAVFDENQFAPVSCGQVTTNNIVLSNGTFSISGRVSDSVTGAGVPNLQMDANTPGNSGADTLTDNNGNYALHVNPNIWSVHPTTGATAERGYLDQTRTDVVITNANVSNINFALSKPTALIYGTIKDTVGNPVVGVQVSTRDPANHFHPVGRSFTTNGSYSIGVQAGTWNNVAANSADLGLRGFTFTGSNANVTLLAGQTTNINFVVTRTNWPSLTHPIHISNGQLQFILNGLAGQPYEIQTVTNLESTNWLALLTTNASCASVFIVDSQATNGQRFYRALILP